MARLNPAQARYRFQKYADAQSPNDETPSVWHSMYVAEQEDQKPTRVFYAVPCVGSAVLEPNRPSTLPKPCPGWVLAYKPNEKGLP
jgi:hypothetical protein